VYVYNVINQKKGGRGQEVKEQLPKHYERQYTEHAFNVRLRRGTRISLSYETRSCVRWVCEHSGALDGVWKVSAWLIHRTHCRYYVRLPTPPITAMKTTTATSARTSGNSNSSTQPTPENWCNAFHTSSERLWIKLKGNIYWMHEERGESNPNSFVRKKLQGNKVISVRTESFTMVLIKIHAYMNVIPSQCLSIFQCFGCGGGSIFSRVVQEEYPLWQESRPMVFNVEHMPPPPPQGTTPSF